MRRCRRFRGRALRIVAQGDGDTGPNCTESPTSIPDRGQGNLQSRRAGSAMAELLVRTRGGWIELAGRMKVPLDLGSPGAVNSRRWTNTGPVVTEVRHTPALPAAGQPVVVTARGDPDTVGTVRLRFRTDPGGGTSTAVMHDDGEWTATRSPATASTVPASADGVPASRWHFASRASDATTTPVTTVFPPAYPASEAPHSLGDAIPSAVSRTIISGPPRRPSTISTPRLASTTGFATQRLWWVDIA